MKPQFILDFDGVLFDSAFEAYSVCNQYAKSNPALRQDVSFDQFLEFRSSVTDAWQYNRLFNPARQTNDKANLRAIVPDPDDWGFSRAFFATRSEIMTDPNWPKIMSPYDFFFLVRPLLLQYTQHFAILSTRNVDSIKQTLRYFGADVVDVFGQEDIRRHGAKIAVAEHAGWLQQDNCFSVYVDDMKAHLEPFKERVHLSLHANWGYDKERADSMNSAQIFMIVSSLLKLATDQRSGAANHDDKI